MTTKQQAKLKMYLNLRIFLLANPAILAKLPNASEFLAALDAAITQIQTNSEQQQQAGKGLVDNKSELKELLITLMMDGSAKMTAYAKYIHNTILQKEVKLIKTELGAMGALTLAETANVQYGIINTHLTDAAPYGLTADTQKQYRSAIDAFATAIPQPRQAQMQGHENTELRDQGFEKGDDAVENLDSVVEIVRLTEPVFYAGYKNARKIIDQGSGTLQVRGTVAEADTGKPIAGATLIFRLSGQTKVVLEKDTADKGGFMIKSLDEGIYEVTVVKVGFQTQKISTVVNWNDLCVLDVKLERV